MSKTELKRTNKTEVEKVNEEQAQKQALVKLGFDDMSTYVIKKVESYITDGLTLPERYNVNNAILSAAMIITQDEKMRKCDPFSIREALVDMVIQGLNPAQKQCYFIPYGGRLTLHVGTWGQETVLKRIKGVIDIKAQAIYEGDEVDFDIRDAVVQNLHHVTKFQNRNNDIIGAYAIIELDEEEFGRTQHIELMTIDEIRAAWGQGQMKGNSPAHKNFPQEMAKKSVRNRAMKQFINSTVFTNEEVPVIEAYQRTVSNEYESSRRVVEDDEIIIQEAPQPAIMTPQEAQAERQAAHDERYTEAYSIVEETPKHEQQTIEKIDIADLLD